MELITILKSQLRDNENIFINRESKLNSLNDNEWWKFEEYETIEEVLNNHNRKEKVKRYWHENGLCIILK